jgi:hypothetical protein
LIVRRVDDIEATGVELQVGVFQEILFNGLNRR